MTSSCERGCESAQTRNREGAGLEPDDSGGWIRPSGRSASLLDAGRCRPLPPRERAQACALVRSGQLPAIKIGGRGVWRIERQQLEAFLDRLHEETAEWVAEHPLVDEDRRPPELRVVGPRPLPERAEAVSTTEAARIIGVTRQNVSHLIRAGSLRARKDGKRWLVSADDARAYRALGRRQDDEGAAL